MAQQALPSYLQVEQPCQVTIPIRAIWYQSPTLCYIYIASLPLLCVLYLLVVFLFSTCAQQEIVFLRTCLHMLVYEFRLGTASGQLCALAMCCHLLGAVMPDHVLGISCFLFYFFFVVIKQTVEYLYTAVQSHMNSLYILYLHSVQTFIGVQINLFSKPQQSHDKLETQSSKFYQDRKTDKGRTDGVNPGGTCLAVPKNH